MGLMPLASFSRYIFARSSVSSSVIQTLLITGTDSAFVKPALLAELRGNVSIYRQPSLSQREGDYLRMLWMNLRKSFLLQTTGTG